MLEINMMFFQYAADLHIRATQTKTLLKQVHLVYGTGQ